MEIGPTIRVYTAEPLEGPVPGTPEPVHEPVPETAGETCTPDETATPVR